MSLKQNSLFFLNILFVLPVLYKSINLLRNRSFHFASCARSIHILFLSLLSPFCCYNNFHVNALLNECLPASVSTLKIEMNAPVK